MKSQPVRGMNDLLPGECEVWAHLEGIVRDVIESYGYREIRLPIIEQTELFRRSIGEVTDIVEKEMYTFVDRNGDSLTLRPEATAGMVRAGISNGLLHNQRQKLWTVGPMFRHEKPQKGRYRQFHQFDVEAMGYAGPDVDAELIIMCARLWKRLGLSRLTLEINSLGTPESRQGYREALVSYFSAVKNRLDEDSIRRLGQNPLRILDSKNPDLQGIIAAAPVMLDFLDAESAEHFAAVREFLDAAGVPYMVSPRLVRGLDYYTRTVFEWQTDALGAQGAVCSGGRYDGLVEKLGGRSTPAIGWAMGVERLVALYEVCGGKVEKRLPDVYVVAAGPGTTAAAFALAESLRDASPPIRPELNLGGGNFAAQLKRADRSGARYALIIGEDEVRTGRAAVKSLRSDEAQFDVPAGALVAELQKRLPGR
ncbi:MAG: histidine--tRNA ligase [Woeseiaceae bacterium]|nr:histidine--tRNA ligase [Woeseiaceae bacterium]